MLALIASTDGSIDFGRDFNLPMSGFKSVVGRNIVIRRLDGDDSNLACSNIFEVPTKSQVLRGKFSYLLRGDILLYCLNTTSSITPKMRGHLSLWTWSVLMENHPIQLCMNGRYSVVRLTLIMFVTD